MRATLRGHATLCAGRTRVTQACPWRLKVMEWMWLSEGQHQPWVHTWRTTVPTHLGDRAVLRQSHPGWHLGTSGCACPCCAPRMGL